MSFPLDMVLFDSGVNCGISRVQKWAAQNNGPVALLFRRLEHYTYICKVNREMNKYLAGWTNRVISLYKTILNGGICQ